MAEVAGLALGAVALAPVCLSACVSLSEIIGNYKQAPVEICALANEASYFNLQLQRVINTNANHGSRLFDPTSAETEHLFQTCNNAFSQLKELTDEFGELVDRPRAMKALFVRRQQRINDIRLRISSSNTALMTFLSLETLRTSDLILTKISHTEPTTSSGPLTLPASRRSSPCRIPAGTQRGIHDTTTGPDPGLISESLEDLQSRALRTVTSDAPTDTPFAYTEKVTTSRASNPYLTKFTFSAGVDDCNSSGCKCCCHTNLSYQSPQLLHRVFGKMFFRYTGAASISVPCNMRTCRRGSTAMPVVGIDYYVPSYVLELITRLEVRTDFQFKFGPRVHVNLRTSRVFSLPWEWTRWVSQGRSFRVRSAKYYHNLRDRLKSREIGPDDLIRISGRGTLLDDHEWDLPILHVSKPHLHGG